MNFLAWCNGLVDYCVLWVVTYPLEEIVFAAFIGIMCGDDDWEDIALIADEKVYFLKRFFT